LRIGLRGGTAVARIDAAGFVHRDGRKFVRRSTEIGWWVAADDRWHDPREEPSRRQRLIDGTPVVETKIAVPGGDVVQRAFMVADHGGSVVMEIANESAAAVVVAVPTSGLSTDAAAAPSEPRGIELPRDVRVFSLAHGSTVRFAWAASRGAVGGVDALAGAAQVVRGWLAASERASRVSIDAQVLVAARSRLLLATPGEVDDLLQLDAARGVLAVAERVRMGEPAAPHVEQIADAVRRVLRKPNMPWASRALVMASRTLAAADEPLASSDVAAAWAAIATSGTLVVNDASSAIETGSAVDTASAVTTVALAEDALVRAASAHSAELFATGIAASWRGVNFEAHGVPAGPQHTVSLAVRWHGENAALLWEVDGPPGLQLRAPRVDASFVGSSQRGEALLRVGA
jgi:hypothetical protein